jgi:hypothetical protein
MSDMADPTGAVNGAGGVKGTVGRALGEPVEPPTGGDSTTSTGAKDASEGGSAADRPGDEERSLLQSEIRDAVADGLSTLGGFDSHTSAVTIVPGGATTFHGPVAGRDIIMGGERVSVVLSAVSARTITEICRVHVPPDGYEALAEVIQRDALVLVRSPRRWGTTTTVIRLLGPMGPVHEVRFSGPLSTLPIEDLPERCGFVLGLASRSQLAELHERDLQSLQDRLRKRQTRLVTVIDTSLRLPDLAVQRRAIDLIAPPPAVELVASHMANRLSRELAEQFLADHDLAAHLEAIDADSFDVRQLVEFAHDLSDAAQDRCTAEEAVARFAQRSRQDLEAWLDDTHDSDQKATTVSLAVLDRMPYEAVARAATLLEHAWRVEDAVGDTAKPRARRTKSVRMKDARGRLTREIRHTRYGPAELEIASFVDASYPGRLLEHLWHEHDYDRDLILRWLRTVAEDVEERVRIRAATAIGFLAQYAFDTIRRDVIVPWAGSGHGDERERAVAALSLPARHPDTAARTVRLVLEWSERKSGPLRLSAARALGQSVGATLPQGPDERLAELAKAAAPDLAVAIGDSVGGLLLDATPTRRLALLQMLDDWSSQSKVQRQTAGVWAFLEVAQGLSTTVPTPDGAVRWPSLLWFATEAEHHTAGAGPADSVLPPDDAATLPAIREVIVRTWSRVLRAGDAEFGVRRVLRNWARSAERQPRLRPPMVSLLVEVANMSPRLADLVAAHARTWRHQEQAAPDLALRLLEALQRGRGIR